MVDIKLSNPLLTQPKKEILWSWIEPGETIYKFKIKDINHIRFMESGRNKEKYIIYDCICLEKVKNDKFTLNKNEPFNIHLPHASFLLGYKNAIEVEWKEQDNGNKYDAILHIKRENKKNLSVEYVKILNHEKIDIFN